MNPSDPIPDPTPEAPKPPRAKDSEGRYNALLERFPKDNLQVMAHFYRGEMTRALAWRQKMDMTTQWAITTTTALIAVAFSNPQYDVILPFASVLIFLLLNIEARRYRFFDLWRTRVRMLEVHLIVPAIVYDLRLIEGNWKQALCDDLFTPSYKISYWEALGRRLQRNYIWLFVLCLVAWLTKVYIANDGSFSLDGFEINNQHTMQETGKGPITYIPGWVVLGGAIVFHVFLGVLLFTTLGVREITGELRRKDPNRKVWPI